MYPVVESNSVYLLKSVIENFYIFIVVLLLSKKSEFCSTVGKTGYVVKLLSKLMPGSTKNKLCLRPKELWVCIVPVLNPPRKTLRSLIVSDLGVAMGLFLGCYGDAGYYLPSLNTCKLKRYRVVAPVALASQIRFVFYFLNTHCKVTVWFSPKVTQVMCRAETQK